MTAKYVYVASSWKNDRQPAVVEAIAASGIGVYDFKRPEGGTGFHWSEVGLERPYDDDQADVDDYLTALEHPRAIAGFESDFTAMQRADALVLVLPLRALRAPRGRVGGRGRQADRDPPRGPRDPRSDVPDGRLPCPVDRARRRLAPRLARPEARLPDPPVRRAVVSRHIVGGTPHGQGDALVDPEGAVLLEDVTVVVVGTMDAFGAGRALAMELGGRVNKSTDRSSTLYVFDQDGAAAIVSELLGLAARVSPSFLDDLLERIRRLP